jgi:hypothetical protein
MRTYPKDYKGPKAGLSNNQEWLEVTEFAAFKYIRDQVWFYSDFDCWLTARDSQFYKKGEENSLKALKQAYKIIGILNDDY